MGDSMDDTGADLVVGQPPPLLDHPSPSDSNTTCSLPNSHSGDLTCTICPAVYRTQWQFLKHSAGHTDQVKRNFCCRFCNFAVEHAHSLHKHELLHKRRNNAEFIPQEPLKIDTKCNTDLSSSDRSHSVLSNHSDESRASSDTVQGASNSRSSARIRNLGERKPIWDHLKDKLDKDFSYPNTSGQVNGGRKSPAKLARNFSDDNMGSSARTDVLNTTVRRKSGKLALFECGHCPAKKHSHSDYEEHMKGHGADRPFKCQYCDFASVRPAGLRKHEILHEQHTAGDIKLEQIDCYEEQLYHPSVSKCPRLDEGQSSSSVGYLDMPSRCSGEVNGDDKEHLACFNNIYPHLVDTDREVMDLPKCNSDLSTIISTSNDSECGDLQHCPPRLECITPPPILTNEGIALKEEACISPISQLPPSLEPEAIATQLPKTAVVVLPSMHRRSNDYICQFCVTRFKTGARLHVHLERSHPDVLKKSGCTHFEEKGGVEPVCCSTCDFKTVDAMELKMHEQVTHASELISLLCLSCSYTTASLDELNHHNDVYHRPADRVKSDAIRVSKYVKCNDCNFIATCPDVLALHKKWHSDQGNVVPLPTNMVQSSLKVVSPNPTTEVVGLPDTKFKQCPHCPYRSANNMERHRKMHVGIRTYQCTECTFSTDVYHALNYHIRLHDRPNRNEKPECATRKLRAPIQCSQCPYRTFYSSTYQSHRRCHIVTSSIKCTECSFSTDLAYHFQTHAAMHRKANDSLKSERLYKEKRVTSADLTNGNINMLLNNSRTPLSLTEGKPVRLFQCLKCPYLSLRKGDLQKHLVNHGRDATFKCAYCDYGMSSEHALQMHQHLHVQASKAEHTVKATEEIVSTNTDDSTTQMDPQCQKNDPESESTHEESIIFACSEKATPSGTVLTCCTCNFECTSNDTMAFHLSGHSLRGHLKCPLCPYSALDANTISFHVIGHSFPSSIHKCDIVHFDRRFDQFCSECPFGTFSDSILSYHSMFHNSMATGFACPLCSYRCPDVEELKLHIVWHEEYRQLCRVITAKPKLAKHKLLKTRLKIRTCKVCETKFKMTYCQFYQHRMRHFNRRQMSTQQHHCAFCKCGFGTLGQKIVHRIRSVTHGRVAELQTKLEVDKVRATLKLHTKEPAPKGELKVSTSMMSVRTMHSPASAADIKGKTAEACVRRCPICPYQSKFKSELKRHVLHHQYNSVFTCALCSFSAQTQVGLEKHAICHQDEYGFKDVPVYVDIYSDKQDVENGLTVDTGNGGHNDHLNGQVRKKVIRCPYCPYVTKHRHDLNTHIRMHVGTRPFKCQFCSYSTERQGALKHHLNLHLDYDDVVMAPGSLLLSPNTPLTITTTTTQIKQEAKTPPLLPLLAVAAVETDVKTVLANSGQKIGRSFIRNNRRVYGCSFCPYITQMHQSLLSHNQQHLGSRPFQCQLCSFSIESKRLLGFHLLLHKNESKRKAAAFGSGTDDPIDEKPKVENELPCFSGKVDQLTRSISVPEKKTPIGNLTDSYRKIGTKYHCSICPYKTDTYASLWYHLQKHKKPGKFQCSECSFKTSVRYLIHSHVKLHVAGYAIIKPGDRLRHPLISPGEAQEGPGVTLVNSESDIITTPDDKTSKTDTMPETPSLIIIPKMEATAVHEDPEFMPSPSPAAPKLHCPYCPQEFTGHQFLDIHQKLHFGKRAHRCADCTFSTTSWKILSSHVRCHGKSLHHERKMRSQPEAKHVDHHHLDNGCKKGNSRNKKMTNELLALPMQRPQLYCQDCPFRSKMVDRMKEHESYHSNDKARFHCADCSFAADDRVVVQRHEALHLAVQRKKAVRRQTLNIPNKLHGGQADSNIQYFCPKCSFQCEFPTSFSRHMQLHAKSRDGYSCSVCDYSSTRLAVVTFHEQNHHGNLPLFSLFSGGPAASASPAAKHAARSPFAPPTSVKPVVRCYICSFQTSNVDELKMHAQSHTTAQNNDGDGGDGCLSDKFCFLGALRMLPVECVSSK